jgi:hypothetical protein
MRGTATLLVTLAMALGAIGLAVAAPGGDLELAQARVEAASGAVSIANSREGQALLSAAAMRPGGEVSGAVRIANTGDVDGIFAVRLTGMRDVRGPYGGALSDQVELVLIDVTDAAAPVTVYAGVPSRLGEVALGTIASGAHRDYEVTVSLPESGDPGTVYGGDNRYQGASLSLGFEWLAGPDPAATPTPTPTPPSTPTPTPTSTAAPADPVTPPAPTPTPTPTPAPAPTATVPPVALADAIGLPGATSCVKRGRLTLRVKAPARAKVLSATVKVNGRVKARLKGARAAKPFTLRGLKKKTKLTISVKAGNGRTYSASRTYRPCKR